MIRLRRLLLPLLGAAALSAEVRLPAILSDHMLIQADAPVRLWGHAAPQESVSAVFGSQNAKTVADGDGRWQLFLDPVPAGGPFELTISGSNRIVIHDVLAGEVWVGSGQSNMELPMTRVDDAAGEMAKANYPQIRLFTVKKAVAETPKDDVEGNWSLCTPDSVKNFSAVAYFFGRDIHQNRHIPVGLIHSSWGGTPAQAWTEHRRLESDSMLAFYLTRWQKTLETYPARRDAQAAQMAQWEAAAKTAKETGGKPPARPRDPEGPGHPNTPAGLYNAMIAPITPYAIRGVLWYQGESNANEAEAYLYRRLFSTMIESWREAWGEGSFPFYFVQLANYKTNGWWPILRESQTATLELRNTAMALAIDIGNPTDIHPTNKQEVGRRLALAARALNYGEKIEYSGPVFRELTTEGAEARLWFDHAEGLQAKGGKLAGFTVAGPDRKFIPAEGRIAGKTVILSAAGVSEPVAVRYAWQDDPPVSLYNGANLPASPFRTDHWPAAKQ